MKKNTENNPFKAMESGTDVPEHLKSKVMSSIHFSTLLLDIGELFTVKIGETFGKLFRIGSPDQKRKDKEIN